jgi:hypothetical protein
MVTTPAPRVVVIVVLDVSDQYGYQEYGDRDGEESDL